MLFIKYIDIIIVKNGIMIIAKYLKKISNSTFAFSLAEVLLALTILGVVFAMLIPTLVTQYNKTAYAVALKRSYSMINQVLLRVASDLATINNLEATGIFYGSDTLLGDNLVRYLKISKNCGTSIGCFASEIGPNFNSKYKVPTSTITGSHYSFITMDNMSYIVESTGVGCVSSFKGASSTGHSNHMSAICGRLWVDVNGLKEPNNYGRDIFLFYITNGVTPGLYPAGGEDDALKQWTNNTCRSVEIDGYACAGRVIGESWDITY